MHAMRRVAHAHAHGIVHAVWHVALATHLCWCACAGTGRITPYACRVSACVCTRACARARVYVCVPCVCNSVQCVRVTACVRACATVCVSLRADVRASLPVGRKGAWGGREYGAEGSLGRKGGWGGREYGAEGSMGRKGVCQHLGRTRKGGIFRGGS